MYILNETIFPNKMICVVKRARHFMLNCGSNNSESKLCLLYKRRKYYYFIIPEKMLKD